VEQYGMTGNGGEGVNFELMKLAVNEDKWW
jgi:hypothetical protein